MKEKSVIFTKGKSIFLQNHRGWRGWLFCGECRSLLSKLMFTDSRIAEQFRNYDLTKWGTFKVVYLGFHWFNDSRGFELVTRWLELVTRGFEILTRGFELVTCGLELVNRGFEFVTREFELVTRGFELATREFELVTCGFELITCGLELVLVGLNSHFWISTRAFKLSTRNS